MNKETMRRNSPYNIVLGLINIPAEDWRFSSKTEDLLAGLFGKDTVIFNTYSAPWKKFNFNVTEKTTDYSLNDKRAGRTTRKALKKYYVLITSDGEFVNFIDLISHPRIGSTTEEFEFLYKNIDEKVSKLKKAGELEYMLQQAD